MNQLAGDGNLAGSESLSNELAMALDLGDLARPVNQNAQEGAQAQQDPPPAEGEQPPGQDDNAAQAAAEAAQDSDPEGEQGDETAQGDDGVEIRKFTDLTAMFPEGEEVTAEDLYGLEIVTAGDGSPVTVGDLKDMYQQRADFETEKAQFAEEQAQKAKELEEARQQAQMQTGEFQQLPQELREAEADIYAIRRQAQSTDWAKLEQDDPGEAALLRQKFRDAHDAATANFQNKWEEYNAKRSQSWKAFVAQQKEKMFQRIPEWRNDDTLIKERRAIDTLVEAYGYTKQEMDSVVDPRLSQLLRDYMLLKAKFDAAVRNHKEVKNRGQKVLRTSFKMRPKARLQQVEDQAKRPGATRQEKHNAMKSILSDAGFL